MTKAKTPRPSWCAKARKLRWPDEHSATRALQHALVQRPDQQLGIYCHENGCGGWHLTSKPYEVERPAPPVRQVRARARRR